MLLLWMVLCSAGDYPFDSGLILQNLVRKKNTIKTFREQNCKIVILDSAIIKKGKKKWFHIQFKIIN